MRRRAGPASAVFARDLMSELLLRFAAVTTLLGVLLIGRLAVLLLGKISAARYPPDVFAELLFYGALESLIPLLPFAALAAQMLVFARRLRDGEFHVAFAVGVGHAQIYAALFRFALPLAALVCALSLEVSPELQARYEAVKELGKRRMDVTMVAPGRFVALPGGLVVHAGEVGADGRLRDVFAADRGGDAPLIERAAAGRRLIGEDGRAYLELENGSRYRGMPGRERFEAMRYARHRVPLPGGAPLPALDDPDMLRFAQLLRSPRAADRGELQRRLSAPLILLVMTLMALPLARVAPRRDAYMSLVAAVAIYFVYSGGAVFLSGMVAKGALPAALGAWWLHAAMAAAAVLALRRRGFR